jgi:molybdopterin synthase catalytic subunit
MRLVKGPVTTDIISDLIAKGGGKKECGAHSLFLGQVRNDLSGGRRVKAIEYSAYEEMVIMEAEKISKTVQAEYDDVRSLEIIHSKGVVSAGELSLVILVSAGHTEQASGACAKIVGLVKEKLPIWKKELFEDEPALPGEE